MTHIILFVDYFWYYNVNIQSRLIEVRMTLNVLVKHNNVLILLIKNINFSIALGCLFKIKLYNVDFILSKAIYSDKNVR